MKLSKKQQKTEGFAILFTVAIVGIISMITIGLSNAVYKQMVLSSVARDSTTAFYQSDIAAECALYATHMNLYTNPNGSTIPCAGYDLPYTINSKTYNGFTVTTYNLDMPPTPVSTDKCFKTTTVKTEGSNFKGFVTEAFGYNICDKSNIRTVERSLKITY